MASPGSATENVEYCGDGGTGRRFCDTGVPCFDPCPVIYEAYECTADVIEYDGTPLFFPIDGHPGALTDPADYERATIPPEYGGYWDYEDDTTTHNFHFTSEIRLWVE